MPRKTHPGKTRAARRRYGRKLQSLIDRGIIAPPKAKSS